MSLLLKLVIARGGSYFVEQPSSSMLGWYPRFKNLELDAYAAGFPRIWQVGLLIMKASSCWGVDEQNLGYIYSRG